MKTVVITGGSDGIGKALAEDLSADYSVIILARNEEALKNIAQQTGSNWFVCDVKNGLKVKSVFEDIVAQHSRIDVVINNAGVVVNGPLEETPDEDIENVITTNTIGGIYVAKAALTAMKPQKSGRIINVISQAGLNTRANRSVYNASKWAMTGFTKALEEEAGNFGILVTGFYPGTTQTEFFSKAGLQIQGNALNVRDIVSAVRYILSAPDDVAIPELSIKPALSPRKYPQ
jgi:short-subunit dehydrogenase